MAFPPLQSSNHVVAIFIDFLFSSQQDAPCHSIAYDHSQADWDALHDHLRDVPWGVIFKLSASTVLVNFVSGFKLEVLVQASIITMVFSCLCSCHSP